MRTPRRRSTISVCAIVLTAALARVARAGDPAVADQLFREGKALMAGHDYRAACPKLEESYSQDPGTGTLLALAVCQEESGRLATAWTTYKGVVARSHQEGRPDREKAAQGKVGALEARLSTLRVNVPGDVARLPGLVVSRDGIGLPPAVWGTDLPTDGGTHVIRATASAAQSWERSVAVGAERDRQVVTVGPLLDRQTVARSPASVRAPAIEAAPATTVAVPPNLPAPDTGSTTPFRGTTFQWLGLGIASAGLIALGIGTGFAIHAVELDNKSRENGHCTDQSGCDPYGQPLNRDAVSAGTTATIFFVAGGLAAAAGAGCYLFGRQTSRSERAQVAVNPAVSVGFAGAQLVATFR
jgi:hypothetical protein